MHTLFSKTLKIFLCLAVAMVILTGPAVAGKEENKKRINDVSAIHAQELAPWIKGNVEYQYYLTFLFPPWLAWAPPWVKPVKHSFTRFWWARPVPVPPPKVKPPASPTVASPPVFKIEKGRNNYARNFGF